MKKHPPDNLRAFTTHSKFRARELVSEVKIRSAISATIAPIEFKSVWDTGATSTVITKHVVTQCLLKPIGMAQIHSVDASKLAYTYFIDITLPNNLEFRNIKVIETEQLGNDEDVLIGMDIISEGDFAVSTYQGRTSFTFRTPSIERIDFLSPEDRPKSSSD